MGITVKYIYSACIVTTTKDVKILHDPWFTEGIYDGSWFQFPKVANPLKSIGDVDYIYITHIHPDHYDPLFLKKYFDKFGKKKIIIAAHEPNHLFGKMRADGFQPIIIKDELKIKNTRIKIIPEDTGSISDIDSAIIIKYETPEKTHCVVNANDMIFDKKNAYNLKKNSGEVDIFLTGYTGAGPYPQTYFDLNNKKDLLKEANLKKKSFFDRYKYITKIMNASVNIPFAGKYILGGKLCKLNEYRGVADPIEIKSFDNKAVILDDNAGEISTTNLKPTKIRNQRYCEKKRKKRFAQLKSKKMDYEKLFNKNEVRQLPLKRLLVSAVNNALKLSEVKKNYYFTIKLSEDEIAIINSNPKTKDKIKFIKKSDKLPQPRSEIIIDQRYLFGLLTKIYHWNNAEVGSQYFTHRVPNKFDRRAQKFLHYLTI